MEPRTERVDLRDRPHDPASLVGPDEDIEFRSRLDRETGDVIVDIRSTRQPAATIRLTKAELDAAMERTDAVRDPALLELERQAPGSRRGHVALTLAMQRFRALAEPGV